jgi:hypothetical protein
MKALIKTAIVAGVCIMLSSCGSIIHGTTQAIDITSQPTGARILIDGKDSGQTPKTIELRRKGRAKGEVDTTKKFYNVKIEMDGYMPYEIKVKREVDGWFFGNLIFGGLIGMIIDASNGAMYKLTPDQLIAQMGKQTASRTIKNDDGIYIAVTLNPDPSWERVGTLQRAE